MGVDDEAIKGIPAGSRKSDGPLPGREATLPDSFGQYLLLRELSRSTRGVTFLATAQKLGDFQRLCVLKVIAADHAGQGGFEDRFVAAGRRLVHLDHRNVAQVFDSGQSNGSFYLAQEHVLGCSLAEVIGAAGERGQVVPVDIAFLVAVDVLRGLYHALRQPGPDGQQLKLWHGRIEPGHVLLSSRGEVKLIGFDREWAGPRSADSKPPGLYDAPGPEDDAAGPSRDAYSVARLLQSMLGPEFSGPDAVAAFDEIRPGLGGLIASAVSRDPEARPRDAGALLRPLQAALFRLNPRCGQAHLEDYLEGLVGELLDRRAHHAKTAIRSRAATAQTIQEEPRATRTLLLDEDEPVRARAIDRVVADAKPLVGLLPGTKYRILHPIGEGGMGTVYAAEHVDLEKVFALKILRQKHKRDQASVVEGLRREARATSKLGHPNIVSVTDFGETPDGRVFFVMEYLEGQSLGELLEDAGKVDQDRLVSILIQVCDGLAAAHEKGVIHRDIKPDNIFLVQNRDGSETVKLLDFGVAVPMGSAKNKAVHIAGTPYYMSPEMIRMTHLDGRADLYSLGVLAYEALCGARPFGRAPVLQLLRAHLKEQPPALRTQPGAEAIHEDLEAIVMRALRKEPEARFPDAQAMADELRAFQARRQTEREAQNQPIPSATFDSEHVQQDIEETWAQALSSITLAPAKPRRSPWRIAIASLGLVGVAAAVWFIFASADQGLRETRGGAPADHVAGAAVSPAAPDAPRPDGRPAETGAAPAADAGRPTEAAVVDEARGDADAARFSTDGGDGGDEGGDHRGPRVHRHRSRTRAAIESGNKALAAGDLPAAESEFRKALAADQRSPEALAGLGRVAFQRKNYAEAERFARSALERNPESARYRLDLGAALFRQGRSADAALLFRQVLQDDPENRAAKVYLEAATKRR